MSNFRYVLNRVAKIIWGYLTWAAWAGGRGRAPGPGQGGTAWLGPEGGHASTGQTEGRAGGRRSPRLNRRAAGLGVAPMGPRPWGGLTWRPGHGGRLGALHHWLWLGPGVHRVLALTLAGVGQGTQTPQESRCVSCNWDRKMIKEMCTREPWPK